MIRRLSVVLITIVLLSAAGLPVFAQANPAPTQGTPAYTPKFPGDPAHSDAEAVALAYMRVVIRAEKQFDKQYGHYATSLRELVHTGSFTRRMLNPQQGEYTAGYKGKKDGYILTLTPGQVDDTHRSFYADEDGKIHAEDSKAADENSPVIAKI